jgi:hypothetical protein
MDNFDIIAVLFHRISPACRQPPSPPWEEIEVEGRDIPKDGPLP